MWGGSLPHRTRDGAIVLAVATVILSDETVRSLVEAHASLAAWYYQMSGALRSSGATVEPPTDEQRRAFVQQLGQHFPELAAIAAGVTQPRPYLPPPVVPTPAQVVENEGVQISAPPADYQATPDRIAAPEAPPAPAEPAPPAAAAETEAGPPASAPPPPPAIVDPSKVKDE